jgi:hypothetical protein
MSKSPKTIPQKGALFNAQYDMCDLVYRKLNELMLSVGEYEIDTEFCETKIRIMIHFGNGEDNTIYFQNINRSGGRNSIGYVNVKKISLVQIEDPMVEFCRKEKNSDGDTPTVYTKWFNKVKEIMQALLDQEQKYEDLVDSMKSLPIFSPTREVLIEKTQLK